MYGGVKLLTVWGEIKGPMAQDAGTTFTTQQSLDILSYLLQQNGLPLAISRWLTPKNCRMSYQRNESLAWQT
jgi:hypothetical protein